MFACHAKAILFFVFVTWFQGADIVLDGKVVSVSDGDTITVLDASKVQHRIRLASIDSPEKSQAFGQRAKQFTDSLVYGKQVRVRVTDKDRYGREIGYVVVDGVSLNELLLVNGFAWHYLKYSKDPEYQKLEDAARNHKVGLWKDPSPIAPWDFRRLKD